MLIRGGRIAESTIDWYAQDRRGNVWYFGEATRTLDARGQVTSTEGSWEAGVNGARPGIIMPARPRVGQSYQQEYYKGHAEDRFRIDSTKASVKGPYGSFTGVISTRETTPLEPDVLDGKDYARGIGEVREYTLEGPRERLGLLAVRRTRRNAP